MSTKKDKKKKKKGNGEIDPEQILLRGRHLFLYGEITEERAEKIATHLYALDQLNNNRILLMINSPGGEVASGMAIIDAIKGISSNVVTIVTGEACSMAALISVVGSKRFMTKNSIWMIHPMHSTESDYAAFLKDRIKGLALYDTVLDNILREHTKLSKEEIEKAKRGEIWLTSDECKKKGVVDFIL